MRKSSSEAPSSHLLASLCVRKHDPSTVCEVRVGRAERPRERFLHGRPLQRPLQSRKAPFFFNAPEAVDAIALGECNTHLREPPRVEGGRGGDSDHIGGQGRGGNSPTNELTAVRWAMQVADEVSREVQAQKRLVLTLASCFS